ncbi:uncharacterized protein LOC116181265 [Photinus pyralis]|nr:uncharacterized protein LOC116172206 [Photinus pyralis]XP_031357396.1 uncharacterized protein LOC116181236 [Photinus pyralis]XP_031357433.1 uncharacterized protein LOC116181265 [Photinus pyralis]
MKLFLVLFSTIAAFYISAGQDEGEFVCQDRAVVYLKNFCNVCHCNNGILKCSRNRCPWTQYVKNCTAGNEPSYKRITCKCVQDLGLICAKLKYPAETTPGGVGEPSTTTLGNTEVHSSTTPGNVEGHSTTTLGNTEVHSSTTPGNVEGHSTTTLGNTEVHSSTTPGNVEGHSTTTPSDEVAP